jgi:hypothetical protein
VSGSRSAAGMATMQTSPSSPTHRHGVLTMLLAALAVLCPGAAVAAPTVIDAPYSAPVSLLHGDTTPPRTPARPTGQLAPDDLRRHHRPETGGLRVRRRIRRGSRRRVGTTCTRQPLAGPVRSRRVALAPSRGPPAPVSADLHTQRLRSLHSSRETHLTGGARSGRQAVTPAGVHTTLRSGAGTAQGALRDSERCDELPLRGCRCRSRRTNE